MVWDSRASGNAIEERWVGFRIAMAHNKSVAGSGRLRRPSSQPAVRGRSFGARFRSCLSVSLETIGLGRLGNSLERELTFPGEDL